MSRAEAGVRTKADRFSPRAGSLHTIRSAHWFGVELGVVVGGCLGGGVVPLVARELCEFLIGVGEKLVVGVMSGGRVGRL